jgi:hypothetical protein
MSAEFSDRIRTGAFLLAAVLGFRSSRVSGCRLMDAACIVPAISIGIDDMADQCEEGFEQLGCFQYIMN